MNLFVDIVIFLSKELCSVCMQSSGGESAAILSHEENRKAYLGFDPTQWDIREKMEPD